jgi:tetratricopeptide (TPR) repeat protein
MREFSKIAAIYLLPFVLIAIMAPSCPSKSAMGNFYDARKYAEKKEYAKAYRCYSRALKLEPNFTQALFEKAGIDVLMDSTENAINDYTAFIDRTKNTDSLCTAYFLRGNVMKKAGYPDACDDWQTSCELNGKMSNQACEKYRVNCKK